MHPRSRTFIGAVVLISTVAYASKREVERQEDRQRALKEQQLQTEDRQRALKVQTEDREREQKARDIANISEVNSLCAEYNKSLRPQASKSMQICRKWTCTNCESAIDIVPFLEKYAKIKAVEENQVVGMTTAEDLEDYNELEKFRKNEIDFWLNKVKRQGFKLNFFNYPGRNELKFFSTFHWAVYMVVNKCAYDKGTVGGEPYTYKWVEESICDTNEKKEYIETYRETLKKEFPRIQKEIFKNDDSL
jgi:hypothetical protein